MSLYRLFKPTSLPTAEETGLSALTIEEANKAVKEVLTDRRSTSLSQSSSVKNRKYTIFKVCLVPEGWSNAII